MNVGDRSQTVAMGISKVEIALTGDQLNWTGLDWIGFDLIALSSKWGVKPWSCHGVE
jgi:hypothetical protein